MRSCKRVIFVFLVVFSLVSACMPVIAQSPPRVYLEGVWDETGIFILKVMLEPQNTGLCGLELDITYDTELLTLSSCERGNALSDLNFDCSLKDGRVRLLFWGTQNSQDGGRLATVCFVSDKQNGECEFSLSLPTDTSAIYFENDRIIATYVTLSGLQVSLESELSSEQDSPSSETPTEEDTELPTELPSELSTDAPPQSLPAPTDTPRWTGLYIAKNICLSFACATSVAGALATIPIFLPDIFRKGYF